MRKLIATLLALLLAALPLVGLAEQAIKGPDGIPFGSAPIGSGAGEADSAGETDGGTVEYKPIACEEMNFSTLTAPSLDGHYAEGSFYIDLGTADDAAWIGIARAEDAPGSQFDYQYYFDNVFTPSLRDNLGSDLIEVGTVQTYTVAGVEMKGVMYTYLLNGRNRVCFVLFDLREDGFVRYEARYYADDSQDCLAALCIAAYYYQPDAYYYTGGAPDSKPEAQPGPEATVPPVDASPQSDIPTYDGRIILSVPQQGFSTLTSTQIGADYVEGEGLLIYTEERDVVPFVQLYVLTQPIEDLEDFIDNGLTPYMQQTYGSDLLAVQELGRTTLAGRSVVGAIYDYRVQGYVIEIYRVYENRGDRTVMYVAKYLQGEGDATMAALEEAVTWFQDDAEYYNNVPSAPVSIEGGSNDRLPGGGASDPLPQPVDTQKPDVTGLTVHSCPELGFATACDPAYIATCVDGDGLYLNAAGGTGIPYVLIYRTGDVLGEPGEYIREQWTPHMQEQYGDDLVAVVEYEYYDVGGKQLPAGKYSYRLQGYIIDALRIIESTPEGTVIYTAKYIQGEGDETLEALDTAVRYMQQDADYYN